jgi:hypothetical protein
VKIEWENPPVDPRHTSPWKVFLEELRKHPGKWARFHSTEKSPQKVTDINKGRIYGVRSGEFEATCRRQDDGSYSFWVRCVDGAP